MNALFLALLLSAPDDNVTVVIKVTPETRSRVRELVSESRSFETTKVYTGSQYLCVPPVKPAPAVVRPAVPQYIPPQVYMPREYREPREPREPRYSPPPVVINQPAERVERLQPSPGSGYVFPPSGMPAPSMDRIMRQQRADFAPYEIDQRELRQQQHEINRDRSWQDYGREQRTLDRQPLYVPFQHQYRYR